MVNFILYPFFMHRTTTATTPSASQQASKQHTTYNNNNKNNNESRIIIKNKKKKEKKKKRKEKPKDPECLKQVPFLNVIQTNKNNNKCLVKKNRVVMISLFNSGKIFFFFYFLPLACLKS